MGRNSCRHRVSPAFRATVIPALLGTTLLLLGGCDSSNPDDGGQPPVLSGTFGSVVSGTNDSISVRISVLEGVGDPLGGKSISGSGALTTPSEVATFDISGSYVHPFIDLDLDFGDRAPGTISGQVSDSRLQITGTLGAPGVGGQVVLRKESS